MTRHDRCQSTRLFHAALAAGLLLCLALAAGCDNEPLPAADSGPGHETGADTGPQGPWSFIPKDTGKESLAVSLKLDSVSGDQASLKVVVRGVSKLQGLAFRLSHDAKQVKVLKTEQSSAWSSSGYPTVLSSKDRSEGELWVGIGHVGSAGLDATSEVTVATLRLQLSGSGPLSLSFRDQHNLVLEPKGKPVKVAWLGGTLVRGGL